VRQIFMDWNRANKRFFSGWIIFLYSAVSVAAGTDPSGTYYTGGGVVWSGDVVSHSVTGQNYSCSGEGMGIVLYERLSTTGTFNQSGESLSGRGGIELAKDVVISLTGNVSYDATGNVANNVTNIKGSMVFGLYGAVSTGNNVYYSNQGDAYLRGVYSTENQLDILGNVNASANLRAELYIGPNATPGTYNTGEISLSMFCRTISLYPVTTGAQFTVVKAALTCNIATPPVVNFGRINIAGSANGSLLGSGDSTIDINCTTPGAGATTDMKISFTGSYEGTYWGRLSLTNTSNKTMAYIRGQYISGSATCTANSEREIGFDGSSGTKTLNNVGAGLTSVPVSWSLCSNGSQLLGDGSAQATALIEWE